MLWNNINLVQTLKNGGVAVMPTDTIYGIVGRAQNISTVNRIYNLKKRNPDKPCIILIGDVSEIEKFSVTLSSEQKNKLGEYWFSPSEVEDPDPVSIIFDCNDSSFEYLHRGTNTLAFRLPSSNMLRNLLIEVGPLVAPSANPEGLRSAKNIIEAENYFGNLIDFYLEGGENEGNASKIIKLYTDGTATIIRA